MLLRNKKLVDPNKGKWIGVGGKFMPSETPEACARREIKEETGFEVHNLQARGIVHFISDEWEDEVMYLFTTSEFTPAPNTPLSDAGLPLPLCNEGELAWIPIDEVIELKLWEGDRVFLEKLVNGEMNIDLTLRYEGEKLVEVRANN